MITTVLKEIGLNQSEIKVYLALLDLGESKSGEILKKSGLNSGRIYEVFDTLLKKGFISSVSKSGVKYFSPADPQKIKDYISEKKKQIEKEEKDFDSLLPELMNRIQSRKEDTKIEVFLGLKGLESAYKKELFFAKKAGFVNILGVSSRENYSNKVYDFFVFNQQPKRRNLNIKIRKILDSTSKIKRNEEHEKEASIKYYDFVSPVSYTITKGLLIIGIHNDEERSITITIESKEVAESLIQQFELLWRLAKK